MSFTQAVWVVVRVSLLYIPLSLYLYCYIHACICFWHVILLSYLLNGVSNKHNWRWWFKVIQPWGTLRIYIIYQEGHNHGIFIGKIISSTAFWKDHHHDNFLKSFEKLPLLERSFWSEFCRTKKNQNIHMLSAMMWKINLCPELWPQIWFCKVLLGKAEVKMLWKENGPKQGEIESQESCLTLTLTLTLLLQNKISVAKLKNKFGWLISDLNFGLNHNFSKPLQNRSLSWKGWLNFCGKKSTTSAS